MGEHPERARLVRELDEFLDHVAEKWPEGRIDQVLFTACVLWVDGDGDEAESPAVYCSSRRRHVQAGLLHNAIRALDTSWRAVD